MKSCKLWLAAALVGVIAFASGCARGSAPAPANAAPEVTDADIRKVDETIRQITALVNTLPKGENKVQRTIQLAEYYWQKAGLLHLRAMQGFIPTYDAWFAKAGDADGAPEPVFDDAESEAAMKKSAALYQFVVENYPDSPKRETAYYYLGQTSLEMKLPKNATAAFSALASNFPQSRLIPEADLALGEYWFDEKQLDEAEEWYARAAQPGYQNMKTWAYAEYKLGWTWQKKGDCQKAHEVFAEIVRSGKDSAYANEAAKEIEQPCIGSAATPAESPGLTREVIDSVIEHHLSMIQYCYERELRTAPGMSVKLVAHLLIEANGRVSSATMTSSTMNRPSVEACMTERMTKIRFPRPTDGKVVTVNYPLSFMAGN